MKKRADKRPSEQEENKKSDGRSLVIASSLVLNKLPVLIFLIKEEIGRHAPYSSVAMMYKKYLTELEEAYELTKNQ